MRALGLLMAAVVSSSLALAGCSAGTSDDSSPATTPATSAKAAATTGTPDAIPGPAAPTGTPGERTEIATFAGGCFWGMQELLRARPGVLNSQVGYTGGAGTGTTYDDVKGGDSGHAESVRLTFDPAVISYEQLLAYLFRIHDPTSKDRQGNDVGSQYRSAIFYHSPAQKSSAEAAIARETAGTRWTKPITTQVAAAGPWSDAEGYHQDYLQKNPGGYTCHWERE